MNRNMKNSILLIGAGQLGSRHLQALALYETPCEIYVIDPFPISLDTAKSRFEEINGFDKHKIIYISTIQELEKDSFDLAIIATNSKIRSNIIKDLLHKSKVNFFILEKVLFQTVKEYNEINELLKSSNSKAFVNCPGRTYTFYQDLKKSITANEQVQMEIIGSNWGLGCNSIHFIDLFNYLTDESILDWQNNLDPGFTNSKREGYKEFFGNIQGQSINGNRLSITCFKNTNPVNYSIRISTPNKRFVIDPGIGEALIANSDSNWAFKKIATKFPYQSQLTQKVVKQLFEKDTCDLTPYELSMTLHIPFITTILKHYNQYQNITTEICPIT